MSTARANISFCTKRCTNTYTTYIKFFIGILLSSSKNIQPTYLYILDDVLKALFLPLLTIDAFLSPNHKTIFDFTLDNPRNVQIQFQFWCWLS